jgi:hypothetical protein
VAESPVFEATPRISSVAISTANTSRDGSGTVGTVISGVAAGTGVRRVTIQAIGTTTAGMVRLFLYDGTNYRALREVIVTAITVGANVQAFRAEIVLTDCILPSASWSIVASTHNAETFHVIAFGADLT